MTIEDEPRPGHVFQYPEYPSARATVAPERYMDAVDALAGVPLAFFDGTHILLPERETAAIDRLRRDFDAVVEYGHARRYEYATKAQAAGVDEQLVSLGDAVCEVTGMSADDMVRAALGTSQATRAAWSALYESSMAVH